MTMTARETAEVLALISRHDRRNLGDTDADKLRMIDEWHRMIGHNDYVDAMNAVIQHKATSEKYLEAVHINAICKAKREQRAEEAARHELIAPDRADYPDMPRDILDELSAAWNDPVRYAAAEARWNAHLEATGWRAEHGTFRHLPPVGSGVDARRYK